jgi:hypothetical protein
MAMMVPNDVRAANDGASAGTDGDALQRSGMGRERRGRQHQRE